MATARTANTVPLRIVQNGGQIISRVRTAGGDDDFYQCMLGRKDDAGKIHPIPADTTNTTVINALTEGAKGIHVVCVEDFDYSADGTAKYIAYQEIDRSTVLEVQTLGTAAPTVANIGDQVDLRWVLANRATVADFPTTDSPNGCARIVDVEQNWNPWKDESDGKNNLIRISILPDLIDVDPEA